MSPMRDRRLAALLLWLFCGTSACTTDDPIVSTPPGSSATTTSTTSQRPSVPPPITRQLEASAYRNKPCELITAEQMAGFGLERASPQDDPGFTSCIYPGLPNTRFALIWVRYYHETDWLGEIYRGKADGWAPDNFIPVTVAGQPAAREEEPHLSDVPTKTEECHVAVGLNDTQGLEVTAITSTSSCDQAIAVAEVIVRNLGG